MLFPVELRSRIYSPNILVLSPYLSEPGRYGWSLACYRVAEILGLVKKTTLENLEMMLEG